MHSVACASCSPSAIRIYRPPIQWFALASTVRGLASPSRKVKSRFLVAMQAHAGELDSIEKMSLQFGIAAPVLCSTASFLLVGIAMAQPAFR